MFTEVRKTDRQQDKYWFY